MWNDNFMSIHAEIIWNQKGQTAQSSRKNVILAYV